MDAVRFGSTIRRLRTRAGLRQRDLAARAAVSEDTIGRVEHGRLSAMSVATLENIVRALGGSVDVSIRWRGGDLARVVNEGHAVMHEAVARLMRSEPGWRLVPEMSFSIYGERGVIDAVAWHEATRTALVIELKTDLVDIGGLLGQVDRYRRLAPAAVQSRGWYPSRVAVWVVVAPGRTNSRRLAEHVAVIRSALPDDGRTVSAWLRAPDRPLACLSFLPNRALAPGKRAPRPIRRVSLPVAGTIRTPSRACRPRPSVVNASPGGRK